MLSALREKTEDFSAKLPHTSAPYSSRSWGNRLHSLCSYQGKFKPALAHWLIETFSTSGQKVLDPLGGVGTIALEARLMGRVGFTCDLSPFASIVASAKTETPEFKEIELALMRLRRSLDEVALDDDDYAAADFGLNARVKDYYHPATLDEVLKARKWYSEVKSASDIFLAANILHILHGNRPYALSRTSHPITPFKPKGEFEYKSLIGKLEERIRRLEAEITAIPKDASRSWNIDFRKLSYELNSKVDAIICSPPFPGMRFDRPNWLRMWFCGWDASNFHNDHREFLEFQQRKSFDVYREFFDVCDNVLRSQSPLVLHVGGSKSYEMAEHLRKIGSERFEYIDTISEDVAHVENHGISDKGTTSSHLLVVFQSRVK